jgi:hypothetical protein
MDPTAVDIETVSPCSTRGNEFDAVTIVYLNVPGNWQTSLSPKPNRFPAGAGAVEKTKINSAEHPGYITEYS